MKKQYKGLILALSAIALTSGLVGCGSAAENTSSVETKASQFTVTFDQNYDGAPAATQVKVNKDDAVAEPAAPTRENYSFTGWYEDKGCSSKADFEKAIDQDYTYYAGWLQTAFTVTFDLNYEGSNPIVETVEKGKTASQPTAPSRDGYIFDGWYEDKACTATFDFAKTIDADLTIYANWSADTGDNITITYMWNYEGAGQYDAVTIAKGKKTTSPMPTRDGYYFEGWYTEATCNNKFDFSSRIQDSYTLYAHWMNIYVFEAEYTNLDGLAGMGYSGNADGVKMITADTERGASNGYFVGWLYNNGLQLKFDIVSDAACDNAIMNLSLSAEYYDITLTDSTFTVAVNGTALEYNDIAFTNVGTTTLAFADYLISTKVPLVAGDNSITLTVTNTEKKTGTIYASAPLVDCMKLYSDTTLSWTPKTSNLEA